MANKSTINTREVDIKSILTRTTGYLTSVCSHSLQPYRGCTYGRSLCGVGCYVQHNPFLLKGEAWGSFLDIRRNAAEVYGNSFERERRWARKARGSFSIFCSSSTDPFVPQERRYGVTRSLLESMLVAPPDELILQTHSHRVLDVEELLVSLAGKCCLRVHISIESDQDTLPGFPPPASTVEQRFQACRQLKQRGLFVTVTVAPLLPVQDPGRFFSRINECAHAVVIDHFIGGDGSASGSRTRRTRLLEAIKRADPQAANLSYRDEMIDVAKKFTRYVGVGMDGFARRFLTE